MEPSSGLLPNLFRTEYSKITAVLCSVLGIDRLDIAEDIVSDTFLQAMETWPYIGLPKNPTAWLYVVAKNKAKNHFKRNQIYTEKVMKQLPSEFGLSSEMEIDLSEKNIIDCQLQMLFAICDPSISTTSQIVLALRILCGFSVDEIADGFLTTKEAINKRLFRAKKKLRKEKVTFEFPEIEKIEHRLPAVLQTLYLFFNEGYYSERKNSLIRKELCLEGMRLTYFLLEIDHTNKPETNALMAIMCYHSSRIEARLTKTGEAILYADQDESLWDAQLIEKGNYYLQKASEGNHVSTYHVEARIAYWNTIKEDTKEKWEQILALYNFLLYLSYSPIAALNRAFAYSKANGKAAGILEAEKLDLTENQFYYILLGDLYSDIHSEKAILHFEKAYALAKTKTEKKIIEEKIIRLGK